MSRRSVKGLKLLKQSTPSRKININLPLDLITKLDAAASDSQITRTALIIQLLGNSLESTPTPLEDTVK